MALQLMKLALRVTPDVTVEPVSTKYFYVAPTDIDVAASPFAIDAGAFFNDSGNAVTLLDIPENSYVNLYVNGVLQMDGMFTHTPGAAGTGNVTITLQPSDTPILAGTPIIVEVVSTNTTSEPTPVES
ncbi:DUF4183 domain-containing protein [Bacillus cereus]|uniref:DUF4183 domain-containing protein n=1 Tax=Bacillus cereus TaxID=1396 RepID=UPI0011A80ED5|nr:DUF4183 domain-containing protein [Bacillus cereus]